MKRFKLLAEFGPEEYDRAFREWRNLGRLLTENAKPGSMSVRLFEEPDGWMIYLYMKEM